MKRVLPLGVGGWVLAGLCWCGGCSQPAQPGATSSVSDPQKTAGETTEAGGSVDQGASSVVVPPVKAKRKPVKLGGSSASSSMEADVERQAANVLETMQPLQVLLGKWNGTSRKAQVDQPEWVWDFRSDRALPALLMKSEKGSYIREGRLTYLPNEKQFQFTWITPEGTQRVLKGDFVEPVQDVPGEDRQLQRTFKLQLREEESTGGEQWQLAFHQQENNRYILEIERRRGSGPFQRIDTVHTQREGTSFAVSDTDYGEKTCIISQGLGTITVSYQGQTYWVCCTGCKAAFEEEPERWIAKWKERQQKMSQP